MNTNLAILFDLDGTLVNSLPDICGVANIVRKKYGLAVLPPHEVSPRVGRGVDHLVRECFPEIPEVSHRQLVDIFRDIYYEQPHHGGNLYPHVLSTLGTLRETGRKIAVATNKTTRVAVRTLQHYLPEFKFDEIVGHDSVSERKPSAKHLLETLDRLQVRPANAWMVGDDNIDRVAAKEAGIRFLGVTWGFGNLQAEESERVRDFTEIIHRVAPDRV